MDMAQPVHADGRIHTSVYQRMTLYSTIVILLPSCTGVCCIGRHELRREPVIYLCPPLLPLPSLAADASCDNNDAMCIVLFPGAAHASITSPPFHRVPAPAVASEASRPRRASAEKQELLSARTEGAMGGRAGEKQVRLCRCYH